MTVINIGNCVIYEHMYSHRVVNAVVYVSSM